MSHEMSMNGFLAAVHYIFFGLISGAATGPIPGRDSRDRRALAWPPENLNRLEPANIMRNDPGYNL